jgi:hypothetical protein
MSDYENIYDKIDTMKFYLGRRENVLFVRYLEQIEEFINNKEVEWNEQQRQRKGTVKST